MKTYYRFLLLFLWMIVIFVFSSEVAGTSSGRSGAIVEVISTAVSWPQDIITFLTRKAAHIFIYFVLGMLMFNVVKEFPLSKKRAVLLSVLFVMLYAITDEFHQTFVPGRSAELRDVLIDTTAGAVGVMIYYIAATFHLRRTSKAE